MAFEWSSDIGQAAWWIGALHRFARDVGSVVPDVFEAFARVFHPVEDHGTRRSWAEVAATSGRLVHPEMQLHEIGRPLGSRRPAGSDPNEWLNRCSEGSLPPEELGALREVLSGHTTAPQCWCGVWEGYGQLQGGSAVARLTFTRGGPPPEPEPVAPIAPRHVLDGPRVQIPGRSYLLLHGPLAEVPTLIAFLGHQSPNVWWPDDRAWFVATEIDFAWTYVGASRSAIDAVLADPRLEALPAKLSDRFTVDSDLLNRALDAD